MSGKNTRSKIWLYAVVLFTSAFIVLLITAYSQIKLNRNLSDLNNQIFTKENEKNKVQLSFANAKELNDKLTEENKRLQEEIDSLTAQIDIMNSDKAAADSLSQSKLDVYEKLSLAETQYLNGNAVESAGLIKVVDPNLLNPNAIDTYTQLKEKVYNEAGSKLLSEGYQLYLKRDYSGAKDKLSQSWLYAPGEKYSDKCLYYLAQAEAKSGNIAGGLEYMKTLTVQFPSSKYLKPAKRFISKYPDIRP